MENAKKERIGIYIPDWAAEEKYIERLRQVAKQQRRSLSFMVIEAIREYLENHKDES